MNIRILAASLMLVSALANAQVDPDRAVATVNGEEIKANEYFRRMEWYRLDAQSGTAGFPAGFLTIKQLITERLIFQMAQNRSVTPTQPEIEAAEKDALAEDPKILDNINAQGRTEAELQYQLKYDLAQFKLRTAGITITDQEVDQHYKSNPSEFSIPKRYKLRVIVVQNPAERKAVDTELAAGKTFAEVAKAHSVDQSKDAGGAYGEVPETAFAESTKNALSGVKIGQMSAWVDGGKTEANATGVKFLVEDIAPATITPLDAKLRKQLRRKLMLDKGDIKNAVYKDLEAATLQAKIVISQPEFQRLYNELLTRLKQGAK